jgi:hypothetical protein
VVYTQPSSSLSSSSTPLSSGWAAILTSGSVRSLPEASERGLVLTNVLDLPNQVDSTGPDVTSIVAVNKLLQI